MTSRRRRALHPVAIIARTPSPLDRLTLEVAAARLSPGDAHRAGGGHVCCTMSFVSCCLMAAISAASCPRSSSAGLRRLAVIEACEDCAHPRVCYNCCRLPVSERNARTVAHRPSADLLPLAYFQVDLRCRPKSPILPFKIRQCLCHSVRRRRRSVQVPSPPSRYPS